MIGCGAIARQYLDTARRLDAIEIVAAADRVPARATAVEAAEGIPAMPVADLLANAEVDVVLNLTIPAAHAAIALQAIAAGKAVYGEKPLAATTAKARSILEAAGAAGVQVGCAPDTVLGTGIQTARKAVDDGRIGAPIAATATMVTPGHERWHPDPDLYYQPGGGPLLDMGPYYVTALVTILGPVVAAIGAASRTRGTRTIRSGARAGETVPVAVDSHVTGALIHESGAISTLVMSFDAVASRASRIEIHGELGSLIAPDPNLFPATSSCASSTGPAGSRSRSAPGTSAARAATGSRTWRRPPPERSRAPVAPSRSTCWTSWNRSWSRPGPVAGSTSRAAARGRRRCRSSHCRSSDAEIPTYH